MRQAVQSTALESAGNSQLHTPWFAPLSQRFTVRRDAAAPSRRTLRIIAHLAAALQAQ